MISHEHRVIFVHVPKTGGTSVEAVLGHHGAGGLARDVQDHRSLRQLQWPHGGPGQLRGADNAREVARAVKARVRPAAHAANRLTVTRAQYRSYHKFGIVRNPWARAYSWYCNVITDPLHQQQLGVPAEIGFAEFLARYGATQYALQPQTHWLVDFSGRIGVDTVCRFERLAEDVAGVCRSVGLPELALPHLVRGSDQRYLDAYDDASRRLVADRHRDEIEAFGYAFEDLATAGE